MLYSHSCEAAMTILLQDREVFMHTTDRTWTYELWEQLPDDGHRYEVLDGVLYMSTAPSPRHQRISLNMTLEFVVQIDRRGLGATYYAPIGVVMPFADPVQPDIVVVLAEQAGIVTARRIVGIPALLVEILSPSNADYDLVTKREMYARAGVPEYWVVRPVERDILVHTEPELATGRYLQVQHVMPEGELVSPTLPFRASIAPFFAESLS
jgi:Uma2 family endonuclease